MAINIVGVAVAVQVPPGGGALSDCAPLILVGQVSIVHQGVEIGVTRAYLLRIDRIVQALDQRVIIRLEATRELVATLSRSGVRCEQVIGSLASRPVNRWVAWLLINPVELVRRDLDTV